MSPLKVGTEDRKKLIAASVFGVLAIGYVVWTFAGSSSSDAPSTPPPTTVVTTARPESTNTVSPAALATARITPSRLDPSLHPEGMLLTESLVYAGSGRNIFQPGAPPIETAAVKIPTAVASPRFVSQTQVNTGPPPPQPINLRFFGTATTRDGKRRAFLLQGDDVFVAAPGDIVSRRYRVGEITAVQVEITDMTNNNTQRIPINQQ